ncbi:MAG TPA: membrane protein insertase YidC [Thermoanaerobaculia bacterium]|jgi:YidC/Oxa1 family membrane protein insertase|nr:membrane protein insertase YidC [Thermoanaerobaculia bacterium]
MESRRLLLAAGLSLGVLLLWEWLAPKPPRKPPAAVPTAVAATSAATPGPSGSSNAPAPATLAAPVAAPAVAAESESTETIENPVLRATFSNRGGVLSSLILKQYKDEQGRPLELVRALPSGPRPLALEFPSNADAGKKIAAALFAIERTGERGVRLRWSDGTLSVSKEISVDAGYLFDVRVAVSGPSFYLLAGPGLRNPAEKEQVSRYVMPASAVAATASRLELVSPLKAKEETWPIPAKGFAGVEDNYFLQALITRSPTEARVFLFPGTTAGEKPVPVLATGLKGDGRLDCSAYIGPKDVSLLASYKLGLERTVDFGWYGILAGPLLWMLKKSYAFVGNWGVAILLVTFVIRLALFPLTAKSYTSMKKMQKLSPKMNAIKDKYKKAKTDATQRQKMNQELMALYQAEGYNPMSGCLPMLLQLPILVAFYNVLSRTIELRHAPFVFWIKDLSAIDSSYVLVILMILSMYAQQAMTPSTLDPAQKKMFMFMPVIWGFFLKDMPSGLVLYWLFSNLLTIVQQLVMNRIVKEDDPTPPRRGAKALKQARA